MLVLALTLLSLAVAILASLAIAVGFRFGEWPPRIDDSTATLGHDDRPE